MSVPARANRYVLHAQAGEVELSFLYQQPGSSGLPELVSRQSIPASVLLDLIVGTISALHPENDRAALDRVLRALDPKLNEKLEPTDVN